MRCRWLPLMLCLPACTPTAAVRLDGPSAGIAPADFPAAAQLLAGFDRVVDDPEWCVGDAVLFGL